MHTSAGRGEGGSSFFASNILILHSLYEETSFKLVSFSRFRPGTHETTGEY